MRRESIFAAFVIFAFALAVSAQTSGFTYQGSLNDNATQANGTYQMRFSLFSDQIEGTQVSQAIELQNVQVADGVFSVDLDFGGAVFDGNDRFLQVEVRRNAGESYVPLNPRQQVKSVPYSIRSANSDRLGGVSSSQYVTSSSNAFITNGTSQQTGNFNVSGNGTANTFNALSSYNIGGSRVFSVPATNTFVGLSSGQSVTTGIDNTFLGSTAGMSLTTANFNTFLGTEAGKNTTSGGWNVFVGKSSGENNTMGQENVFAGAFTGFDNTTGSGGTFIGYGSGQNNTTGLANVFVGRNAGEVSTTGNSNVFVGDNSGDANTNGNSNTFVGGGSGGNSTTGQRNTFIGGIAGTNNTTGSDNTLLGENAQVSTGGLTFATAIGADSVVSSSSTVQLGRASDRTNISGTLNVLNGRTSFIERGNVNLYSNSGDLNLYMQGGNTGDGIVLKTETAASGNSHFFISHYNGTTFDHRVVVKPDGRVEIRVLDTGGNVQLCRNSSTNAISTCSSSMRYKSNVETFSNGLSIIRKLRPVSFKWTEGGMLDMGLVAEEIAEVEPLLTTQNEKGETEGVKYDRVGVVLVNAVQEQQKQIEDQQTELKKQEKIIKRQQTEIELLKKQQKEFAAIKALVCSSNPTAEVCKIEEKTETEDSNDPTVKGNK